MFETLFNFIKGDSSTGIFLWICEIFKNSFFHRKSLVAPSKVFLINPKKKQKENKSLSFEDV